MDVVRFVGSSLTLFDAVVDRVGFINNGFLFKVEYNVGSKKALAFSFLFVPSLRLLIN